MHLQIFEAIFASFDDKKLNAKYPDLKQLELNIDKSLSIPNKKEHGDYATNLALILAKSLKVKPQDIAWDLAEVFRRNKFFAKVEIAGPGFINFFIKDEHKFKALKEVFQQSENFGKINPQTRQKVMIEFVSANPTGPLHVGHGRGAIFGDSLVRLLKFAGCDVVAEYYINDAGRQMDILTVSFWLRYLAAGGDNLNLPENLYQGDYLINLANKLYQDEADKFSFKAKQGGVMACLAKFSQADLEQDGDKLLDELIDAVKLILAADYSYIKAYVLDFVLVDIQASLQAVRVNFDSWFSEASLVDEVIPSIKAFAPSTVYKDEAHALWFKSTDYGDQKDRVLIRSNGLPTYFASDMAYHRNKFQRGFDKMINVFGADHHGYVTRITSAMQALGFDSDKLKCLLVQFAVLYKDGKKLSMSTRAGSFVELADLVKEVGVDATRYFYTSRKQDSHLDFDLDLAKARNNQNPVFYIQYAHARVSQILLKLKQEKNLDKEYLLATGLEHLELLTLDEEQVLIGSILNFSNTVKLAAKNYSPHFINNYTYDLATAFHSYYAKVSILKSEEEELLAARVVLVLAVQQVLKNALSILNISAPDFM